MSMFSKETREKAEALICALRSENHKLQKTLHNYSNPETSMDELFISAAAICEQYADNLSLITDIENRFKLS